MIYTFLLLYIALFSSQVNECATQGFQEFFQPDAILLQDDMFDKITTLRELKETFIISFKLHLRFTGTANYRVICLSQMDSDINVKQNILELFWDFTSVKSRILIKTLEKNLAGSISTENALDKWSDITISQFKSNSKYFLQLKLNNSIILKDEVLTPQLFENITLYATGINGLALIRSEIKDIYIASGSMKPCESEEWKYYEGFCYWSSLYHKDQDSKESNWFYAVIECRKSSSDIVSILNENENRMVFELNGGANTWIGLVMVNGKMKTLVWNWLDNSQLSYTNWASTAPLIDQSDCSYLNKNDGTWVNNLQCGKSDNYYVCKKQATGSKYLNISSELYDVGGNCGKGGYALGKKCYYVYETKADYFEALIQCQKINARIASIHSSIEGADLTRIYSRETQWIGLENTNPNEVNKISSWKWSDGTPVKYENWIFEGIHNDQTKQCGVLQKGARWENVNCWKEHPFVCEKLNG